METLPDMDLPRKRGDPASISLTIKCPVASTPWGRNARTTCTGPPLKAARPVHPPRTPASSQDISGYERLGDFQSVVESERLLGADVSLPPPTPYPVAVSVTDTLRGPLGSVPKYPMRQVAIYLRNLARPRTPQRFSIEQYLVGA